MRAVTSSVFPQIFLWVLKDNDLTGMAFIDTQLHIHQMFSIKNFILAADLMKSISLLRYQEESKTLSLVSRVRRSPLCQMMLQHTVGRSQINIQTELVCLLWVFRFS